MIIQNCETLDELWACVNELNKKYFPKNNLMPILGNGRTYKPKIMFVFINPTARNISSDKNWQGPRFPFIGTKQVWRVFYEAGLFDTELINKINSDFSWSLDFTDNVLQLLRDKGFYFTNIVKCTGHDATLPDSEKVNIFLPVMEKEIEIVQPEHILTFGLIPFEKLTKHKIKLSEYYNTITKTKRLVSYDLQVSNVSTKIIPCYFPVGRGNPKKAVEILKLVNSL